MFLAAVPKVALTPLVFNQLWRKFKKFKVSLLKCSSVLVGGGANSNFFEYPTFIVIWDIGSPKITFVLKSVSKTPPYGEFENGEIVKEIKISKYS